MFHPFTRKLKNWLCTDLPKIKPTSELLVCAIYFRDIGERKKVESKPMHVQIPVVWYLSEKSDLSGSITSRSPADPHGNSCSLCQATWANKSVSLLVTCYVVYSKALSSTSQSRKALKLIWHIYIQWPYFDFSKIIMFCGLHEPMFYKFQYSGIQTKSPYKKPMWYHDTFVEIHKV